ncbi:hypothetical protein NPIL_487071 [Nephila pilipes]|uniref:Uncharacterized protein n=1 Tax=Nephila pilipes TaxID=299642 RepID=A0A8X6TCR8_NEPPI|nr:hypothetical protein NPIL_487071 [Nephila pilipes]
MKQKRKIILSLLDKAKEDDWFYLKFLSNRKIVRLLAWINTLLVNTKDVEKNLTPMISLNKFEKTEKILNQLTQIESFAGIEDPNIRSLRPIEDAKI